MVFHGRLVHCGAEFKYTGWPRWSVHFYIELVGAKPPEDVTFPVREMASPLSRIRPVDSRALLPNPPMVKYYFKALYEEVQYCEAIKCPSPTIAWPLCEKVSLRNSLRGDLAFGRVVTHEKHANKFWIAGPAVKPGKPSNGVACWVYGPWNLEGAEAGERRLVLFRVSSLTAKGGKRVQNIMEVEAWEDTGDLLQEACRRFHEAHKAGTFAQVASLNHHRKKEDGLQEGELKPVYGEAGDAVLETGAAAKAAAKAAAGKREEMARQQAAAKEAAAKKAAADKKAAEAAKLAAKKAKAAAAEKAAKEAAAKKAKEAASKEAAAKKAKEAAAKMEAAKVAATKKAAAEAAALAIRRKPRSNNQVGPAVGGPGRRGSVTPTANTTEDAGWAEDIFSPLEPLNLWQGSGGTPSEETRSVDGASVGRREGAAGLMELVSQAGTGQPTTGEVAPAAPAAPAAQAAPAAPAASQQLLQEVADLKAKLEIAELKRRLQEVTHATPPPPASPSAANTPPVSLAAAESVAGGVPAPAVAGGGGGVGMQATSQQVPQGQPQLLPPQANAVYHQFLPAMGWRGKGLADTFGSFQQMPQAEPTVTLSLREAQFLGQALGQGQARGGRSMSLEEYLFFVNQSR